MSTDTEKKKDWLDFDAIKANADVITVLSHYGLVEKLERRSNEFVGWCPLGTKKHGKKDSFNFNVKKKTFKCFACKQHGSTLDFVAKYQTLHLRESAEVLAMINSGNALIAPLPRNDSEEAPIPTKELDSEASEQTEGEPELAEIEGGAPHSPLADDPANVPMGMKRPDKKSEKYHFTLEEASMLVTSGKMSADRLIVLDKAVLFDLMDEIDKIIAREK